MVIDATALMRVDGDRCYSMVIDITALMRVDATALMMVDGNSTDVSSGLMAIENGDR